MKNYICWNHITLQLKLKTQLIYNYYATTFGYYNYCATILLEIRCIHKQIATLKNQLVVL